MFRYLPFVLKNSWRNRRRTLLTIVSISVSLALLGVLMAVYYAFYFSGAPPSQALRLVTRNRVSLAVPMPKYYGDRIKQIPGVREVCAYQWFGGVYKDSRDPKNFFARFAVEPEKILAVRTEMQIPEDQKQAFLHERTACLIGRDLAKKQNFQLGDRINIKGDIFPVNLELTVRAIYDAPENNESLYFNLAYMEQAMGKEWGQIGTFYILADSPESVPRIAKAVDDEFHNSPIQTKTESERAFALSFVAFLGNVKLILLSICAAVTFTILLVSANTIAMSVRERVREVGVLKTLGFTRGTILSLILGEAVAIATLGGAIGVLLASGLCGVVRRGPAFSDDIRHLSIQPPVIVTCVVVAATIGLISAFVPAWNASRTPIVDALRSTE
ncbi:MAG TPA: FtsX-like permease family protein [Bryobacteraceae bacterium]|nr:FtsX-like permease family protein [Bryobacteraceae bacterium]